MDSAGISLLLTKLSSLGKKVFGQLKNIRSLIAFNADWEICFPIFLLIDLCIFFNFLIEVFISSGAKSMNSSNVYFLHL